MVRDKDQHMRNYLKWLLSKYPKQEIKYEIDWKRFKGTEVKSSSSKER